MATTTAGSACRGRPRGARCRAFGMVFGNEPGTKLVVELHEVGGDAFARTVQTVVQLPTGEEKAMEAHTAEEITLKGRLVSYDACMRDRFVVDGRVLERAS